MKIEERAVKAKAWRWLPGMLVDGMPARRVGCGALTDRKFRPMPDFTDPATMGCLLALVREAWSDPGVSVWYDRRVGLWSWMADGCIHSVHRPSDKDGYDTEAEALIAALEAAPEPKREEQ